MKIAIYSRKSVDSGKGESIENQIEMCRGYIFSHISGAADAEITVYEDEGFSGRSLDRPQFRKMMEDSKNRGLNYIVCYRLDRISRSVSDFSSLIEELNSRGIYFICIKEQFDTTTPIGRAMMYIASVFAQLERETIAERVRDNMLLLARSGRWLGGCAPTGYCSDRAEETIIDGRIKTSYRLRTNEDEIGVCRIMFSKYLELRSINAVARYLEQREYMSRNGRHYSLCGIKDILKNPVYCIADRDARDYFLSIGSQVCFEESECSEKTGILSYNKRSHIKDDGLRRDSSLWIIAKGKHKGIIRGSDWAKVQTVLAEGRKQCAPPPRPENAYSLLSGKITCAICGSRMFSKRRSCNRELFDYICSGKLRFGKSFCCCANLVGPQTDRMVCDFLTDYVKEGDGVCNLLCDLKKKIGEGVYSEADELDIRIGKSKRELDSLFTVLCRAGDNDALIRRLSERISALDERIKKLEMERRDTAGPQDSQRHSGPRISALINSLSCLRCISPLMSMEEKRQLVSIFNERLTWDGKELSMYLKKIPASFLAGQNVK